MEDARGAFQAWVREQYLAQGRTAEQVIAHWRFQVIPRLSPAQLAAWVEAGLLLPSGWLREAGIVAVREAEHPA